VVILSLRQFINDIHLQILLTLPVGVVFYSSIILDVSSVSLLIKYHFIFFSSVFVFHRALASPISTLVTSDMIV
jgi:hypothetical protein